VITAAEVVLTAVHHQVLLFLHLMKGCAARRFHLVPRKENLDCMARLGISLADAKERILGLAPSDYVSGPSPDLDRPGQEVWVFGLKAESAELYVKLTIILEPEKCVCISFHPARQPLCYPLRGVEREGVD
jgi:hypothetical protein